MSEPTQQQVQRSRACHLCKSRRCSEGSCAGDGVRVMLKAPKPDDPDYKVAVCPHCDELVMRADGGLEKY